ncbi:membrane protein [Bacillus cereus]|nr:membrane protein [Bacillus cereus]
MGMKTKLYFSLASTILFAIAVIVFFINGNPQKWFWFFIFFASIIQNIVLLKKNKELH